jgi:hypothetical protein
MMPKAAAAVSPLTDEFTLTAAQAGCNNIKQQHHNLKRNSQQATLN